MGFNNYRFQYEYSDLEITAVGKFGHVASQAVNNLKFQAGYGTTLDEPITKLSMKTNRDVLLARIWETETLLAVNDGGEVRNAYTSQVVCRDLISMHYDKRTGSNLFRAAEDLLEDPAIMTRRTVGMLSLIGTANRDQLIIDTGVVSDLIQLVRSDWSPQQELQALLTSSLFP